VDDGILVNIPDRTLYIFEAGRLKDHFPVGLGKPTWKTPTGDFKILNKMHNPTWYVPESIQKEMAAADQEVIEIMPPGPDNPLGRWALKTSIPGILLHETNHPESVYGFRSHGCIRMKGVDAWVLYEVLDVGDTGVIDYIPVKLARTTSGRVFLEVHKDAYGMGGDPLMEAVTLIEENRLDRRVDWEKVAEVATASNGRAYDVTAATKSRTARNDSQTGIHRPAAKSAPATGVQFNKNSL
jgi:L,D-transpeptidase ErfK/SrfK